MEVDDTDLDSALLQQFSCLGTTDKEVLITQFHKLVGNATNERDAAFYLDMNNWNLQEAVGAYFDLQSGPVSQLRPAPSLSLLQDVTVGEGESVTPSTSFIKTWRIKNTGSESWPADCLLRFLHGHRLSEQTCIPLPCLGVGEVTDVSIEMRSPAEPGIFQGKWRATTAAGTQFGDEIWVIVTVQHDGLLAVTQQMTRLTGQLGSSPSSPLHPPHNNPFAAGEPPPPPAAHPPPHQLPTFGGVNAPGRPASPHSTAASVVQWEPPNTDAEMD